MRYAMASLFTLLIVGMASGVPDNPASTNSRLAGAPDPAACMVSTEPYVGDIAISAGWSSSSPETWDALRAELARSTTPSETLVVEARATLRELMACMNGGETAQILALYTEIGRRAAYDTIGLSPSPNLENREQRRLVPPWLNTGRVALLWSGEPRLLPDGRLAVPVITRQGAHPETWSSIVLARQDGRYLIDAVAPFPGLQRRANAVSF